MQIYQVLKKYFPYFFRKYATKLPQITVKFRVSSLVFVRDFGIKHESGFLHGSVGQTWRGSEEAAGDIGRVVDSDQSVAWDGVKVTNILDRLEADPCLGFVTVFPTDVDDHATPRVQSPVLVQTPIEF